MRPTTRIDPMLARLREVWLRQPDQRLAQLLVNLVNPTSPCPEVSYMEGEALLERIEAALAKPAGTR